MVGISRRRVVAVFATLKEGYVKLGSGYLVKPDVVLTAWHCSVDEGEAVATPITVVRESDGHRADVGEGRVVGSRSLDLALLMLDAPPWNEEMRVPRYVRVDRDLSGVLGGCEALGYPAFQLDVKQMSRGLAELNGEIRRSEDAASGLLVLRDPGLISVSDPYGPVVDQRAGGAWSGLSGAVVFHQGRALGVVIQHQPRQGSSSVRVRPLAQLATDGDHESLRIHDLLEMPDWDELEWALPHQDSLDPRTREHEMSFWRAWLAAIQMRIFVSKLREHLEQVRDRNHPPAEFAYLTLSKRVDDLQEALLEIAEQQLRVVLGPSERSDSEERVRKCRDRLVRIQGQMDDADYEGLVDSARALDRESQDMKEFLRLVARKVATERRAPLGELSELIEHLVEQLMQWDKVWEMLSEIGPPPWSEAKRLTARAYRSLGPDRPSPERFRLEELSPVRMDIVDHLERLDARIETFRRKMDRGEDPSTLEDAARLVVEMYAQLIQTVQSRLPLGAL